MTLEDFFILLIVGLIAGWLAGVVMKGRGYGFFGDIILGIVGAIVLVGLARVLRGGSAESRR